MIYQLINGRIGRIQFAILLFLPIPFFIAHPFFNQGDSIFFYYWFPYAMFLANKRIHDFGVSMFSKSSVQFANIKYMLFKKGNPTVNKYGKPPKF